MKLISLDNDYMFHFIFDVIYRKPCSIHIKSVRKVMSTTFSEISLVFESLSQFFSCPPTLPPLSQKFTCCPASLRLCGLHCPLTPPSDNYCTIPKVSLVLDLNALRSAHTRGLVAGTCFGDQSHSVYSYFVSKF